MPSLIGDYVSDALQCYRCGASLEALSLPLTRLDECPQCHVYLHCCRMCSFYDPAVAEQCREDDAEEVRDKERANFCDYFKPVAGTFDGKLAAAEREARGRLDALFGADSVEGDGEKPDNSMSEADKLFK